MVKFAKVEIEKLYLPSTVNEPNEEDKAWVKVKNKVLFADTEVLLSADSEYTQRLNLLVAYISEWNFTDENNAPLEINEENVAKLEAIDAKFIVDDVNSKILTAQSKGGLTTEEKKALPSTSTQPTPGKIPVNLQDDFQKT